MQEVKLCTVLFCELLKIVVELSCFPLKEGLKKLEQQTFSPVPKHQRAADVVSHWKN